MLPFGGQGANQSIEDGAALGFLLNGVEDCADIPKRLELFSQVRQKRASRIQILSRTRIGREKEVEHELRPFAETPDSSKSQASALRPCRLFFLLTRVQWFLAHSQSASPMISGSFGPCIFIILASDSSIQLRYPPKMQ